MTRVLAWFSCGDASAVAAKLAIKRHGDACEVIYCDTFAYEHPDNRRFMADVEKWLGCKIKVLRSEEYRDIYDVFEKTGWLIGPGGARCTTELKKMVRKNYQRPDDIHIFGFTMDEVHRVDRFYTENPELFCEFPLIDAGYSKKDCHDRIRRAGIELPAMYRLVYKNNNCIGCVKGGIGYWNKIRKDFPEAFERMARMERKLDVSINTKRGRDETGHLYRHKLFLDEMPARLGRYESEKDIECGVLCINEES